MAIVDRSHRAKLHPRERLYTEFTIQLFDDFLTMLGITRNNVEEMPDPHRAATPIEALMRAAPGDGIEQSQEELLGLRELLEDALAELSPEEQEAVMLTLTKQAERHTHRTPLRKAEISKPNGDAYSKSGIAKVRDRALEKLRRRLENEPLVLEHIARNHARDG